MSEPLIFNVPPPSNVIPLPAPVTFPVSDTLEPALMFHDSVVAKAIVGAMVTVPEVREPVLTPPEPRVSVPLPASL